jgi:hypothetical protein
MDGPDRQASVYGFAQCYLNKASALITADSYTELGLGKAALPHSFFHIHPLPVLLRSLAGYSLQQTETADR